MSAFLLQIGKLPSNRLIFTDRVYTSPSVFHDLFHTRNSTNNPKDNSDATTPIITVGSHVYAVEANILVPAGQVALSHAQRSHGKFKLGIKVKVTSYTPSPECALAGLELHVTLSNQRSSDGRKKILPKEIDTDYLFSHVMDNYAGHVVSIGQVLVTDFQGTEVELTVSSFGFVTTLSRLRVESENTTSTLGSTGQLLNLTDVRFRKGGGKKRGKKRVLLTGSKVAGSKLNRHATHSSFLKDAVEKFSNKTRSFPGVKFKRSTIPHVPCTMIKGVDVNDLKKSPDKANVRKGVGNRKLVIVDENKYQSANVEKRKKQDVKTINFCVTLKSLGGIIMSNSIMKRGKGQKELPIFAVISYPSDALNTKNCTWSNIPSAPLKSSSSSIGNRKRYYANFAMKQAENYVIKFTFPMKRRRADSMIEHIPQEIDLRIALMRGTELIAAGTTTLVLNGMEKEEVQNIPVNKCKRKKETIVQAGSFRSDPNKKYSLQRSFLRIVVHTENPFDKREVIVSDISSSCHTSKGPIADETSISSENLFSRFTDSISKLFSSESTHVSDPRKLNLKLELSFDGGTPRDLQDVAQQSGNLGRKTLKSTPHKFPMYIGGSSKETTSTEILCQEFSTDERDVNIIPQLSIVFTDDTTESYELAFADTAETSLASSKSSSSSQQRSNHGNELMTSSQSPKIKFLSDDSLSYDSESSFGSSSGLESFLYDSSDIETVGTKSLLSIRSDLPGYQDPYSDTDLSISS